MYKARKNSKVDVVKKHLVKNQKGYLPVIAGVMTTLTILIFQNII